MLREYENAAWHIVDNSKGQKPDNPHDLSRLADAMIVIAGAEIMTRLMGGKQSRFDGMRQEEFRQGVRGSGRGRRGGSRSRFDGYEDDMDDEWFGMETEYREGQSGGGMGGGGGRSGGGGSRGGQSGGGGSRGGSSGGSRSNYDGF